MDECTEKKVRMIAKIEIQEYFNHYLVEVFPDQLTQAITAHNRDVGAHEQQIESAVSHASLKFKVWVMGLVFTGGVGGGVGLARLILQ